MLLMAITKDPAFACGAVSAGVDRVFVDLEVMGKYARQGGRDTVISGHTIEDLREMRRVVPGRRLLARINPWHEGSGREVAAVLAAGADIVMLPMFRTLAEVDACARAIAGRAALIPLVETIEAFATIDAVADHHGVAELYLGLNDLHLALGRPFMFELLADGTVDRFADTARRAGKPFGFGGVARLDGGLVPGRLVLSEHVRLGSTRVILSRSFFADCGADDLAPAVAEVRKALVALRSVSGAQLENNREALRRTVRDVAAARSAAVGVPS